MTKTRNKSIAKQVMIRDLGLCRCCGFQADEVHHIIPLVLGGEDTVKNMISLCSSCHYHAPNTKEEFYEYMNFGGDFMQRALGKITQLSIEAEQKTNGVLSFMKMFTLGKQILKFLQNLDFEDSIRKYNFKESLEVEDVDFSDVILHQQKESSKEVNLL